MQTADYPFPRRYNSLRLSGFDYSSTTAAFSVTLKTDASRPVFGDTKLAKQALSVMLDERTLSRIRVWAYALLPDHPHLLVGVRESGKTLSTLLGAYESLTTQIYWKRAREIINTRSVAMPSTEVQKNRGDDTSSLLRALTERRASLRPECVELKNWPTLHSDRFLGKRLWQGSFHDHVIRNESDFLESVDYILLNPVRRGYVSKPEFYPFSGVSVTGTDLHPELPG